MVLIKPPEDWSDELSNFYDGPPPPPATYTGKVAWMGLSKVQDENSTNYKKPKVIVRVEITQGKYKGASILTSFTLIKSNAWSWNSFLQAMTDGSEKQRKTILKWYYEIGFDAEKEAENEKMGRKINFIGKPAFKPIDRPISFTTNMNGEYANIAKWVIPLEGGGSEEGPEESEESLEGMGEFAEETTSNPEPEPEAVAEEPAEAVAEADDDDPWA